MKTFLLMVIAAVMAQCGRAFIVSPSAAVAYPSSSVRKGVACAAAAAKAGDREVTTLRKTQVVAEMAAKSGLNKTQSEAALMAFLETVSETLCDGDKINLVGFGTFETRYRRGREGRHPKTGEPMIISDCHAPAFSAAKALKETVKVHNAGK